MLYTNTWNGFELVLIMRKHGYLLEDARWCLGTEGGGGGGDAMKEKRE
jgi:hypothetical protein